MLIDRQHELFRATLLQWYNRTQRPLPWKEEKDPYLIWLSEIILQQTRARQGAPYYERFKSAYPTVRSLANAPADDVMKLWEGLGYYARARNMHEAARYIAYHLNGQFPSTYEDLLKIKGIGPYTAAAIASFAYNLPHAVVDGNVFRVLSRFLGAKKPIDTTAGKKYFEQQAQLALDCDQPARYNQAIMDFGATVCLPRKPACLSCPLQEHCQAFRQREVERLPIKAKKIERRQRYFHFIVFNCENSVCLQKRTGKDIWRNLYEFPSIEMASPAWDAADLFAHPTWSNWLKKEPPPHLISHSRSFQQTLTHQIITATFWEFTVSDRKALINEAFLFVERKNLSKFAFPKIVDWYLNDNSLYLNL